ncbi:MAG: hypothetical protein AAB669_02775 [Patescibacteria group bacterium]
MVDRAFVVGPKQRDPGSAQDWFESVAEEVRRELPFAFVTGTMSKEESDKFDMMFGRVTPLFSPQTATRITLKQLHHPHCGVHKIGDGFHPILLAGFEY